MAKLRHPPAAHYGRCYTFPIALLTTNVQPVGQNRGRLPLRRFFSLSIKKHLVVASTIQIQTATGRDGEPAPCRFGRWFFSTVSSPPFLAATSHCGDFRLSADGERRRQMRRAPAGKPNQGPLSWVHSDSTTRTTWTQASRDPLLSCCIH